ncbi:VOC family protein [Streptomyces sp. UNOB3_S3]|uniref:VOC family protein n=1 Tax=Streptomyces sp. UNOB3_S3 TaxID=2871682 RepID=UPI001E39FCDD|nr:VOC family protein [Streptomyces sp. UNOB3_S3]MCC3778330.1 VOC family protein [Streptomyces sp. UNOB3_S3]
MLTATHVPGGPNWLGLTTPDAAESAAFYGAAFGWTYEPVGPEERGFGLFRLAGRVVASCGPSAEPEAAGEWQIYFRTVDAEATAKAVEQAGGTVRFPAHDVLMAGRAAGFTDPTGARFAVWQPREVDSLDAINTAGALCWTELYSTDAAVSKAFYGAVFPWDTSWEIEVGTHVLAVIRSSVSPVSPVSPAGAGGEAQHGAIMQLLPENLASGSRSEWHPYFATRDCDGVATAAAERGAETLIPPVDVPGVGRAAMFRDPFGAAFGVIQGEAGGQG